MPMVFKYWTRSRMGSLLFCKVSHQGKELDWQLIFETRLTCGRDDRSLPCALIAQDGAPPVQAWCKQAG
jgi:hypothetical protein